MQVAFCLMWLNSESESNRGSSPESKASKLLKCIAGIAQRFVSASFDMFRLFHDGFALDRIWLKKWYLHLLKKSSFSVDSASRTAEHSEKQCLDNALTMPWYALICLDVSLRMPWQCLDMPWYALMYPSGLRHSTAPAPPRQHGWPELQIRPDTMWTPSSFTMYRIDRIRQFAFKIFQICSNLCTYRIRFFLRSFISVGRPNDFFDGKHWEHHQVRCWGLEKSTDLVIWSTHSSSWVSNISKELSWEKLQQPARKEPPRRHPHVPHPPFARRHPSPPHATHATIHDPCDPCGPCHGLGVSTWASKQWLSLECCMHCMHCMHCMDLANCDNCASGAARPEVSTRCRSPMTTGSRGRHEMSRDVTRCHESRRWPAAKKPLSRHQDGRLGGLVPLAAMTAMTARKHVEG